MRDGEIILLEDQDRALWDQRKIAGGRAALDRAIALRGRGPYVLQAAIASLHVSDEPDWPQIGGLYRELARITGSAVVELNRAIAVAQVEGVEEGLELIDTLPLDGYRYLHSTRAELLRRLGRTSEARASYERALELTHTESERRLLRRLLARLG
jgi:RNA polymerase sigma-70 factor (ECF subfamily)